MQSAELLYHRIKALDIYIPLHFVYSVPAFQGYGAHIFTPASYKTLTSSKILDVLTQTYFVYIFRLLGFSNCHTLPTTCSGYCCPDELGP